jgi:CheY-like chemotaxis protein
MTLLIVDDNAAVREMIRQMMQPLFSTIQECPGGREAVASYESQPADAVIMDIQMPEMDGIEAAEEILAQHPDAQIYLVTAWNNAEYRRRALALRATAFYMKDNLLELFAVLERLSRKGEPQ